MPVHCQLNSVINKLDKAAFTLSHGIGAIINWHKDNMVQYIVRELPAMKQASLQLQPVLAELADIKTQASGDVTERKHLKRQLFQAACEEEMLIKAAKKY